VADLQLLGIKPDRISFTSDYFELLYQYAIKLIKDGYAYADDTPREEMRDQRFKGIASKRRDESVEENLTIFEEMKNGTALNYCIRAKISIDNPNKAMRDPVIYRCNLEPHARTGTRWRMYPTYDFSSRLSMLTKESPMRSVPLNTRTVTRNTNGSLMYSSCVRSTYGISPGLISSARSSRNGNWPSSWIMVSFGGGTTTVCLRSVASTAVV
jgi:hypothetical protein